MRVPNFPPRPAKPIKPIITVSDHRDAGCILTSYCSENYEHSHEIGYDDVIGRLGNVMVDHDFARAMTCPICGAAGGGLGIRVTKTRF